MKKYYSPEKFTIWENEEFEYFIQMAGKEIEDKVYNRASEAIEEAEGRNTN